MIVNLEPVIERRKGALGAIKPGAQAAIDPDRRGGRMLVKVNPVGIDNLGRMVNTAS